jgi:hypothetical protein
MKGDGIPLTPASFHSYQREKTFLARYANQIQMWQLVRGTGLTVLLRLVAALAIHVSGQYPAQPRLPAAAALPEEVHDARLKAHRDGNLVGNGLWPAAPSHRFRKRHHGNEIRRLQLPSIRIGLYAGLYAGFFGDVVSLEFSVEVGSGVHSVQSPHLWRGAG